MFELKKDLPRAALDSFNQDYFMDAELSVMNFSANPQTIDIIQYNIDKMNEISSNWSNYPLSFPLDILPPLSNLTAHEAWGLIGCLVTTKTRNPSQQDSTKYGAAFLVCIRFIKLSYLLDEKQFSSVDKLTLDSYREHSIPNNQDYTPPLRQY
jgi:hypothetical protein